MRKLTFLSLLLAGASLTAYAADVTLTVGGGTGTEADPYIVSTPAHLAEIAKACNDQGTTTALNSHYTGCYFKMTKDIDMSGVTDFIGIGTAAYGKASGYSAFYFDGNFDGGGYYIRNLNIDAVAFNESTGAVITTVSATGASRSYIGFFGTLGPNAIVKNLNIDDKSSVKAYGYVGSIAGYLRAEGTATKPGMGSQIINCTSAAKVTAYGTYSGGIAAYGSRSAANGMISIEGCAFYGTAESDNNYVAGILGYGSRVNVLNCANYGSISNGVLPGGRAATTARTQVAGIIGNATYCAITNCLNAGYISAMSSQAGGIVGIMSRTGTEANNNIEGTITSCVNTGSINNPDKLSGGVLGYCSSTSLTGLPVLTDCYVDGQLTAQMGQPFCTKNVEITGITGLPTATMTSGQPIEGLDPTIWKLEAGFYPQLAKFANTDISKRAAATYFTMPAGVDAADFQGEATISSAMAGITATATDLPTVTISGSKITAAAPQALTQGTITLTNGTYTYPVPIMQVPVLFSGKGTEADPYILQSKTDIINLAESVNGPTLNHYEGAFFKITKDIDMENAPDFIGIGALMGNTSAHSNYFFSGTIDGDGHTISNMRVTGVGFNDAGTATASALCTTNAGFIGTLSATGTIKNLNFDSSCAIEAYAYTGTVVGRMLTGGKVINCTSAAKITAYNNYIGGIVGYSDADTADADGNGNASEITNCLFSGSILSNGNYNGGITGFAKAIVTNCVNTGSIDAHNIFSNNSNFSWTGGIAGHVGGALINCANYGPVNSDGNVTTTTAYGRIGGIAGEISSTYKRGIVTGCVNTGGVTARAEVVGGTGMIVGTQAASVTPVYANNYYDAQLSLFGAVNNEAMANNTALPTAQFTDGKALEGLSAYTFAAGFYPIPTVWAQNDIVRRAAATYITLPEGQTISSFNTEGVISTAMPIVASFAEPTTVFSIANGKVIAGATQEIASATLILTNGAYFNKYDIMKVPAVLPGSGTEADPWQVATAADFIKVANYMTSVLTDFKGEYFKVLADLDFAETEFVPISTTTLAFNGVFDGNGKAIKNVSYEATDENRIHHIGLFTNLGENAVIKNLTVDNSKFTGYGYTSAISATCAGRIENVTINANCAVTGTRAGTTTGTNADGSYVGSLAASSTQTAAFVNCVNRAPVSTTRWYAGGLVGYGAAAANNVATTAEIRGCINYGSVVSTVPLEMVSSGGAPTQDYTKAYVGGIAGAFGGKIVNTINAADSVKAATANYIGGFVGGTFANTSIDSCINRAAVHGANYVGGFIGYNSDISSITLPSRFLNSRNEGRITAGSNDNVKGNGMYVAGFIAFAGKNWSFIDCANEAEIKSLSENNSYGHSVGGLAGYIGAGSTNSVPNPVYFKRCYNTAPITGVNTCGGLIGYTTSGMSFIDSCFNTGDILCVAQTKPSMPIASGIAGGFQNTRNTYNAGSVTGWVAGGIGYGLANDTVENCYNMGKLVSLNTADPSEVGNILINDRTGMSVKNCYALAGSTNQEKYDTIFKIQQLDSLQLCNAAERLGSAFANHRAAFPMIAGLDTVPAAQFAAAWYILADGNTLKDVHDPVVVADLSHVVWSCPTEGLFSFTPGLATPLGKGETALVATVGSRSKSFAMTANAGDPIDIVVDGLNIHLDLETMEALVMPCENGVYEGVVVIPDTVVSVNKKYVIVGIAESAFQNSKVTELTIPATVKTIAKDGCRSMADLKKVTTPSIEAWLDIEFANANANPLVNCGNLTIGTAPVGETLTIPAGTEAINAYAFQGLGVAKTVALPAGLKTIGNSAFSGAKDLKSIEIPNGCKMGESLFFNCTALENVVLPADLIDLPASTFSGCSAIKSMKLEEGIQSIGMMAFNGCTAMTSVEIPSTVKSVGMMAFSDCSALTSFTTKAKEVPVADMMAFDGIQYSACTLFVPEGTKALYAAADEWSNFTKIEIDNSGVDAITADDIASVRFFSIDGREIVNPEKGQLVIAVFTTKDGKKVVRKIVR